MEASEAPAQAEHPGGQPEPEPQATPEQRERNERGQFVPAEGDAQPGDVGEALQQMRQSIDELRTEVRPEPEQPPVQGGFADQLIAEYEDGYEEQAPQGQQPADQQQQLSDDEMIANYIRQEASNVAQAKVEEAIQRQTVAQRHAQIASLPERYPRMKEPEVVAQVAARLRGLAAEVGDSVWNSPAAVESAYQAYEAALRRDAEGSPEGESHAATLETGGGAAALEPEQSLEEKAYAKVFERVEGTDPLTR